MSGRVPSLTGIDHVHVYVRDRTAAAEWFLSEMGLVPETRLQAWAAGNGPLTLRDATGSIHIALFETRQPKPTSTIAFGATGSAFLDWLQHFRKRRLELRVTDHDLAYSMYFRDPDDNSYEITTCEHGQVREALAGGRNGSGETG